MPKYGQLTGKHVTEVAPVVFEALKKRASFTTLEEYTHRYPVCWRCGTDVVFRVANEWYISVEELRPRMLSSLAEVEWTPEYAGKRMENWLQNMGDWNISRKRYWGLVLPFLRLRMRRSNRCRNPARNCANWRSTRKSWTTCPNCTGPGWTK